jgi:hypothetical protein
VPYPRRASHRPTEVTRVARSLLAALGREAIPRFNISAQVDDRLGLVHSGQASLLSLPGAQPPSCTLVWIHSLQAAPRLHLPALYGQAQLSRQFSEYTGDQEELQVAIYLRTCSAIDDTHYPTCKGTMATQVTPIKTHLVPAMRWHGSMGTKEQTSNQVAQGPAGRGRHPCDDDNEKRPARRSPDLPPRPGLAHAIIYHDNWNLSVRHWFKQQQLSNDCRSIVGSIWCCQMT